MEKVILKKQQFRHEGDKNLYMVLAEFNGEYVVWLYNAEFDGYSNGKYFNDLESAKLQYKADCNINC